MATVKIRRHRVRYFAVRTERVFELGGRPLASSDERLQPLETAKPGRLCRKCGARMSIYHHGETCWPCMGGIVLDR